MDINDLFSQLKTIEPRKEFTEQSRRLVLASPRHYSRFDIIKGMIIDTFRMSAAIALAAALVLVIVNATFLWKILPTPQVAVLDPVGLHAEAQAIDMQIQLAQVNFGDLTLHTSTISIITRTTSPSLPPRAAANPKDQSIPKANESINPAATTAPTSTDIDSALQELAK